MKKPRLTTATTHFIILSLTLFTLTACNLKFDDNGDLLSSTSRSNHSFSTMKRALEHSKYSAKYAVKTYKIIYETEDSKGDSVQASGLLAVPQKPSSHSSPLLVHLHGTTTKNNLAPSYSYRSNHLISKMASLGYVVIAPDYIGYGKSRDHTHPFLHQKTLASSTIDMMRASKQWLKNHGKLINKQVFLEGYSEGGFAVMATHKKIQENDNKEFTVTGSTPAGGAYDLSHTVQSQINKERIESPVTLAFIIKAYNDIYSDKLIRTAIKPALRTTVRDDIDNGSYTMDEINKLLGYQTDDFLQYDFVQDMRDGIESLLSNSLKKNNVYDWKPKAPIRIIHGREDEIIPYHIAEKTLDTMIANGTSNIELVECDVSPFEAKHDICSVFANDYAIEFFNSLANNL